MGKGEGRGRERGEGEEEGRGDGGGGSNRAALYRGAYSSSILSLHNLPSHTHYRIEGMVVMVMGNPSLYSFN